MIKKIISSIMSVTVLTSTVTTYAYASDSTLRYDLNQMNSASRESFESVVTYLGYTSIESFINRSLSLRTSVVGSDRIKDLNNDNIADPADSSCIIQFLQGALQYANDYNDLDVTGDCIIDKNDAEAYLYYYVHYLLEGIDAPFSAHGNEYVPTTATEIRRYIKHTYNSGTAPNSTDVEYCLGANLLDESAEEALTSTLTNVALNYGETYWEYIDNAENSNLLEINDNTPYVKVQDTRVIRCAGSGAIIGPHTILTNAHCVYSKNDDTGEKRYSTDDVCAFTFDEDGEPHPRNLTVVSYHVPKDYITYEDNNMYKVRYDYALIVVEEDLTEYGCFDLGYALDGIVNTETDLTVTGFPQAVPCQDSSNGYNFRKYMVSSNGEIIPLTITDQNDIEKANYRLRGTAATSPGSSGSPMYTKTAYIELYDIQIGLITGGSHGLRFTKPMLEFFFNNDYLGLEELS